MLHSLPILEWSDVWADIINQEEYRDVIAEAYFSWERSSRKRHPCGCVRQHLMGRFCRRNKDYISWQSQLSLQNEYAQDELLAGPSFNPLNEIIESENAESLRAIIDENFPPGSKGRNVLDLLMSGMSQSAAGRELGLTQHGVWHYVNVFRQLPGIRALRGAA